MSWSKGDAGASQPRAVRGTNDSIAYENWLLAYYVPENARLEAIYA